MESIPAILYMLHLTLSHRQTLEYPTLTLTFKKLDIKKEFDYYFNFLIYLYYFSYLKIEYIYSWILFILKKWLVH